MSDQFDTLQEQLNEAIENCNFALASQIKDQIEEAKQSQVDDTIQRYIDSFQSLAEDCKNGLDEEMADLEESISNQEMLIRRKVSNIFHELQVKHVEALIEVEKDNLLKYAKDKLRPVTEAIELYEQAKLAGINKKFKKATKLKEKAINIEESEYKRREEVVKNEFFSKRTTVLNKQKDEIRNLTQQLKDALYNLQKRKEYEIEKTNQRYKKNLLDAYENTRIFINSVKDTKLKNICIKECAKIYKATVMEAFPSDPFKSPPPSVRSPTTMSGRSPTPASTRSPTPQTIAGKSPTAARSPNVTF